MRLTIISLILIVGLGLSQTVSAQLFYNRVGSLDPTLNGVGYVGVGAGIGLGTRTKQLSDGSLILIGSSNNGIGVQKISYDGTSDGGFGSSGYVNIPCGGCLPTDLVELSDGKLLIAGQTTFSGAPSDIFLSRLNSNGSLDTSFGTNGFAIHDLPAETGQFSDESMGEIAILGDGSVLAAAITSVSSDHINKQARGVLIKFAPSGALDTTFGTGGFTQTILGDEPNGIASYASHISLLPKGRVAAAFNTNVKDTAAPSGYVRRAVVLEYLSTGQIDTEFEKQQIDGNFAADIGATAEGGLLVITDGQMRKLSQNGQPDPEFGSNGFVNFPPFSFMGFITVQPSGKFYVTGYQILPPGPNAGRVQRFWANGKPDLRFGRSGSALVKIGGEHLYLGPAFIERSGKVALQGVQPPNNQLYIRLIANK